MPNNDLYNTTIEHRGRLYRYDPDFDCFYPLERYKRMTVWETWSPVIAIALLSAVAVYIEYVR